MILYYAMGGGLGHLTRARAFLHALGIEKEAAIITASNFAADARVAGDCPVIPVERSCENDAPAFRESLRNIFEETKVESLYLDSFPLGITGELADFAFPPKLEINYLARLLKWRNYAPFLRGRIPRFNKTFLLEPLGIEQQEFIAENSEAQFEFELTYPPARLNPADEAIFRFITNEKKPFWLVVHSGNEAETTELLTFAAEMREIEKSGADLILISPHNLSFYLHPFFQFDLYPARILFKDADRIFTACGFNAMRQTEEFRHKHYFIPFDRRFDDQFERAKRLRKAFPDP